MATKFNYERPLATANRMLNKFGGPRKLIKKTKSGDPARPTITPVEHACVGVEFDVTTEMIDGKNVLKGDKYAYLAPSLQTEAFQGDSYIDATGVKWEIQKVEKLAPNGVNLLWTFWLRK